MCDGDIPDYFPVNMGYVRDVFFLNTLQHSHRPYSGKDVEVGLRSVVRNCPDH